MSRPIKFRAWDKRNAQMLYKISVADGGGHVWVPEDEIMIMTSTTHYEDAETGYWLMSSFELMQYTGLKDKNGTEIYEGDIVKWIGDLYEIIWDQEYAQFNHRAITCDTDDYFECDNNEAQEVIGNIHENPELLEQEVKEMS